MAYFTTHTPTQTYLYSIHHLVGIGGGFASGVKAGSTRHEAHEATRHETKRLCAQDHELWVPEGGRLLLVAIPLYYKDIIL